MSRNIKNWKVFNENASSDNFKDDVNKIRQYFLEYEDDNIVSYEMYVCGQKENAMLWSINPNTANFDRWLESQTEEANRYIASVGASFGYRKPNAFIFSATIKISAEDSILDDIGVDKLQDVLTTWNRLKDNYDKVLIDMNSQHQDYKPVTLKVYFNPIVD